MSFSKLSQRPFSILFLAFFLAIAPSVLLPFSFLYRHFALFPQSAIVLIKSIFFLLLVPAAIIKYVWGRSVSDFGWTLPSNNKAAMKLAIIALLLFIPVAIALSTLEGFQLRYSSYGAPLSYFLLDAGLFAFLYYIAEGFLFFGFLFFGLWPRLRYHSFWIVSIVFAFLHITKPPLEILFSLFGGLIFCYLSVKTRSIFPAAIVHFIAAFILNVLVTFAF